MSKIKNEYIERYKRLHRNLDPVIFNPDPGNKAPKKMFIPENKLFDGTMFYEYALPELLKNKEKYKVPMRILDYGCGKGIHAAKIFTELGHVIQSLYLYDPCVPFKDVKPNSTFNIITCIDVMEHVPEDAVDEVLADLFSYLEADGLAIFVISSRRSYNEFNDGTNLHVTIKPIEWWQQKLKNFNKKFVLKVKYEKNNEQ